MSKKVWVGVCVIAGLYLIGRSASHDHPRAASASVAQSVSYSGPPLPRTDFVTKNNRDPMTGQDSYMALLASDDRSSSAMLGFKCDGEASLLLTMINQSDNVSNLDHIFFDTKVGDGSIFQVFGQKLGTNEMGTTFQLEEDKLQDLVKDGEPIYLRYTVGNRIITMSFVPNGSAMALAPVRRCKH